MDQLSAGDYYGLSHSLEAGLFKHHNEIVAASIFTGHDVFILLHVNPNLINVRDVKRFFTVVDGLSIQFRLLLAFHEEEMLALWNYIRMEDEVFYNKMHVAFLIDDSSVRFFTELVHNKLTGDEGLMLVDFSDYSLAFYKKNILKSMVKHTLYGRQDGNPGMPINKF